MKTTLYEISDRYAGFMALVDSGEIDDPQAITDTLEAIQMEFDQKVDNIASWSIMQSSKKRRSS